MPRAECHRQADAEGPGVDLYVQVHTTAGMVNRQAPHRISRQCEEILGLVLAVEPRTAFLEEATPLGEICCTPSTGAISPHGHKLIALVLLVTPASSRLGMVLGNKRVNNHARPNCLSARLFRQSFRADNSARRHSATNAELLGKRGVGQRRGVMVDEVILIPEKGASWLHQCRFLKH